MIITKVDGGVIARMVLDFNQASYYNAWYCQAAVADSTSIIYSQLTSLQLGNGRNQRWLLPDVFIPREAPEKVFQMVSVLFKPIVLK